MHTKQQGKQHQRKLIRMRMTCKKTLKKWRKLSTRRTQELNQIKIVKRILVKNNLTELFEHKTHPTCPVLKFFENYYVYFMQMNYCLIKNPKRQ